MTNREYLRNILTQLTGELATLRPQSFDGITADANSLHEAINSAIAELDALDVDKVEEAYHIKPIYDRVKAVIAHERIVRNQLDRIALAADNAIDLCNIMSAHVEDSNPGDDEDDAL
jgi:hypothetical protein